MGGFEGPKVVSSGLVGLWDADNAKSYPGSGTTWYDLSTNLNNGTLNNTPTYSTNYGGGLDFNGSNQYVSVPASSAYTFGTSFSVNIWISSTSAVNFDTYINRSTSSVWNSGFGIFYTTSTSSVRFYVNSYTTYYADYSTSSTFGITNFTGVYDGANVLLYRNGILETTGSALTASVINPSTQLCLMADSSGSTYSAPGSMYNASLYNRALSASEVLQNFRAFRGRFGV